MVREIFICTVASGLLFNPIAAEERRIGRVAFFGQEGLDVSAIREALPVREGDLVAFGDSEGNVAAASWKERVSDAVMRVTGRGPTDVTRVCCDEHGQVLVYIGLPGTSVRTVPYSRAPAGAASLPATLVKLREHADELQFKAIAEGRGAEDSSEGYSLATEDSALRKVQLEWRDAVRQQEARVYEVLRSSADAGQRAVAATAVGYARPGDRQIDALVDASFDADEGVRNNAVRALAVTLMAHPERGRGIPAARFVDLLSSPVWSDRNKGLMFLQALTANREAALLRHVRHQAWSALIEMAQWPKVHALPARVIVARVLGVGEQQLAELVNEEPADRLLQLAQRR